MRGVTAVPYGCRRHIYTTCNLKTYAYGGPKGKNRLKVLQKFRGRHSRRLVLASIRWLRSSANLFLSASTKAIAVKIHAKMCLLSEVSNWHCKYLASNASLASKSFHFFPILMPRYDIMFSLRNLLHLHETSATLKDLRFVAAWKKGCQAIPRSVNLPQLAKQYDSVAMSLFAMTTVGFG